MLTQSQFRVLCACAKSHQLTQRQLASSLDLSLGAVNKAVRELKSIGQLQDDLTVTDLGISELESFRVGHAIILAAGMSTRFAPLSFEKPKALFRVRGEVLIERLICQLQGAGIEDIRVVVGHMKEQFYYLEDKFGVHLIENPDYLKRNNHASLRIALDGLEGGSYICSSDQFYAENLFSKYELGSWCSVVQQGAEAGERPVRLGAHDRLVGYDRAPSEDAWHLLGPAYFDEATAHRYLALLGREYDAPDTFGKLWEQIAMEHAKELPLWARRIPAGTIYEFDFFDDLCAFDTDFIENVDSRILDNICSTLSCARGDITHVEPLKAGLTNLSVLFDCKGERYVYRHPGAGTEEIVNRDAETIALKTAAELGLDTSFIFEDPAAGWKISRFIPDCVDFDYRNESHVSGALAIARRLHESGATSPYSFDFYDEARKIVGLLKAEGWRMPEGFDETAATIAGLVAPMREGSGDPVLCHNDFYGPNLLVHDGDICLIDWEYAAMGDYGCDIGNFVAQGSGYSVQETLDMLPLYYGRPATDSEAFHCIACVAVVGWYWYVWAMYKECKGSPVGEWLRIWYKAAREYGAYASTLLAERRHEVAELTHEEFDVLVAAEAKRSLDSFDVAVRSGLEERGMLSDGRITWAGVSALEPHRVRRAIFLAAGFGSRMLPITINTPKPLVRVHGVRIIDRLLDAVVAAGIKEIYVVRGYLKEEFEQLRSKYPSIVFIDNPRFDSTNNISSALLAREHFEDAYVFESDLFLADPSYITKYQYRTNYLAFHVDRTEDWCFAANDDGKIVRIAKGCDGPCWQMVGLSYWSAADGRRLSKDIPAVFDQGGECQQIFWDDVALDRRPENYDVFVRPCSVNDIVEIDSFEELQAFDPAYRIG